MGLNTKSEIALPYVVVADPATSHSATAVISKLDSRMSEKGERDQGRVGEAKDLPKAREQRPGLSIGTDCT
jgi:hypothetical protein